MREKIRRIIDISCDILELLIAVTVGVGLIGTAAGYLLTELGIANLIQDMAVFMSFLENMFYLVIGIEFIKMLLKPNAKNVIEVLVFLIVRHMIIGENDAWEILISVHCVVVLYGFNYFLHRRQSHLHTKKNDESEVV